MPSNVNRLIVQDLATDIGQAGGLIVLSYGGLTAKENVALRDKLAEKKCELRMVRNALARLVLKERGFELPENVLVGNVAIAFGSTEAILHAAKYCTSPAVKKPGKVKFRAAVLEGNLLGPADAEALANVPDRPTLQSKILGCISGPARGLVSVLNGTPGGLARVLQARADNLEKSQPEPAPASAPEAAAS